MKIYTRTGDDGTTGLSGGRRVAKCEARIDCTGGVDELNAALGVAHAIADLPLRDQLARIQGELFTVGSHLAIPSEVRSTPRLPVLDEAMVRRLESEIDQTEADLPPLSNFVLPGGTELAARLHLARTICRRAERAIVQLATSEAVSTVTLAFINRLSDWLFVQARAANLRAGVPDVLWVPTLDH